MKINYFTQTLSMDGQQIANYEAQNFNSLPLVQVMEENRRKSCSIIAEPIFSADRRNIG